MCQTRSIYNVTDPWRWLDLELDLHFDEQALSKFDLRFDEHRRHFRFNQSMEDDADARGHQLYLETTSSKQSALEFRLLTARSRSVHIFIARFARKKIINFHSLRLRS